MRNVNLNKTTVYLTILVVYIGMLICATVLTRNSIGKEIVHTEWFWGYKVDNPNILYRDNLLNILLYIPIGCLVGLIVPKNKFLAAALVGLFLSETVECSQLIWHKGTFDVDDIFNNTLGAMLGGLSVVLTMWIRKKRTVKP